MKRLFILILLITITQTTLAQTWQDTVNTITHYFDRYNREGPGCQLSISLNGKIVFSKAWGLADIERHVPYTTETVTEAGSITKQFTAACILLLEQQGKLSLDDNVRKYIPELPEYGTPITLSNLLHHTSGIREWSSLEAITGWPRTTKAYTNEDVLNMLYRQKKLNNIPGTEYIYSNSNYLLLTAIIERLSGMTLPEFSDKYIFKPAGMTHTRWRDNFKAVVPNRGIAYIKRGGQYRIDMPNENLYGPGALLTNTDDLLKWTNYILNNKLGEPGLLYKQLTTVPIPGGADAYYAAGLFIGKYNGYDIVSHTGQTAGYLGAVESLPALKLSVAWLSNAIEFTDSLYIGMDKIDNLFIGHPPKIEPVKSIIPVKVPAEKLKQYVGWYSDNRTNKGANITQHNDTLLLNGVPMMAINDVRFKYKESWVEFNRTGRFTLTTTEKVKIPFTKRTAPKPNPAYVRSFVGTYYSPETESSFKLSYKDGKLVLDQNYLRHIVFSPTYKDAFSFSLELDSDMSPVECNILFKSSDKNIITGCLVSMYDARNIEFVKTR